MIGPRIKLLGTGRVISQIKMQAVLAFFAWFFNKVEAVGLERVDSTARVGSSNLGILGFLINVTSEVSGKSTDSSPRP
jgi:hypothetical protein